MRTTGAVVFFSFISTLTLTFMIRIRYCTSQSSSSPSYLREKSLSYYLRPYFCVVFFLLLFFLRSGVHQLFKEIALDCVTQKLTIFFFTFFLHLQLRINSFHISYRNHVAATCVGNLTSCVILQRRFPFSSPSPSDPWMMKLTDSGNNKGIKERPKDSTHKNKDKQLKCHPKIVMEIILERRKR